MARAPGMRPLAVASPAREQNSVCERNPVLRAEPSRLKRVRGNRFCMNSIEIVEGES